MKVIAINGSPRKEGSTAFYLGEVLNRIEANGIDTELVQLADYNLAPCNACMECWNQQSLCTINDGLAGICDKILDAEGLLLGSPVYYGGVTSPMKAFIDRSGYGFWAMTGFKQADWDNPKKQIRPLRNKVGGVVATGYRIGMTSTYLSFSSICSIWRWSSQAEPGQPECSAQRSPKRANTTSKRTKKAYSTHIIWARI